MSMKRRSGGTPPLHTHLDAETWTRSEALDPDLNRDVPRYAPAEAVVSALHHHGAGGLAMVVVEADGVDEDHGAHLLVHHHRAQIDAVREDAIVRDEGGRRPSGTWRRWRLLLLLCR